MNSKCDAINETGYIESNYLGDNKFPGQKTDGRQTTVNDQRNGGPRIYD